MEDIQAGALERDIAERAKILADLQNSNPMPETGTLGFVMGLAEILGGTAAVYTQEMPRPMRRRFERIVLDAVQEAFDDARVTGHRMASNDAH